MVDNLFFDTKSEESDTPMQTEPSEKSNELAELCSNDLNLSESKFKPITTNRLPAPDEGGQFLDIKDNLAPNAGPPPQPCFFPPMMPPFPPGMTPGLMPMPASQLGVGPPPMPPPGGWKRGMPTPWGKPAETKDNSSSPAKPPMPPPFFGLPMIPPPGAFPPPGLAMPPNFPNLPFPPPFLSGLQFPFPAFGRDLKKINKRWGRSKRAKGKVDIDKATGRKLITAITCVACFKAKKKCIYADQNAKRCNYCLNRGINCVKRIDRRCQKVWHESGRRARLYAKAVGGDEEMHEMKEKSEGDLGALKNEELRAHSDKENEDEIGSNNESDLLLGMPDPSRRYFRDSKESPLWMLVAGNANSSNAQVG
jgi:hypothetical protein